MTQAIQQRTGWVGWIYFAGVLMILSGSLNIINGVVAAVNPDWVVFTNREALLLDISGWGWVHIIVGAIIFLSGFGIMKGNILARTVGGIMAAVSLVANFAFLPAYPFWSIVIITVDILVLWAIIVHGDELAD